MEPQDQQALTKVLKETLERRREIVRESLTELYEIRREVGSEMERARFKKQGSLIAVSVESATHLCNAIEKLQTLTGEIL